MSPVRVLLFDLGATLTLPQREDAVARMMEVLGCGSPMGEFRASYSRQRPPYDRGTADAEAYWKAVARELGLEVDERRITRLKALDVESWFNMNPEMLKLVSRARALVARMGILSNINAEGAAYLASSCPWASVFDAATCSCDVGALKPERRIYEAAAELHGAEPGDCLFVDDMSENVEGARAAGMAALRFTDVPALRAALSRHGLEL